MIGSSPWPRSSGLLTLVGAAIYGLSLWTFQVNGAARRFYERHGFTEVERTDGSHNDEHEPDVRYVWQPGREEAGSPAA